VFPGLTAGAIPYRPSGLVLMKLVVGCGYLGSRVAALWREENESVAVVTRSAERALRLQADGYLPVVADVTDRPSLDRLRRLGSIDSVLYAVGYDRASGNTMREVYVEGLRAILDALPTSIQRIIYISTTGVYAQNDGSLIDEDSACEPTRGAGRVCLEAESVLRGHAAGTRAIILRLAGIYGPGRIPRREELLSGKPIAALPDAWLNLVHVDDAARIVLAVDEQVRPPRLYVVSDGHPVQRREYYAEAARLLRAPPPDFSVGEPQTLTDRRGSTDKRVNNARLRSEVRFDFQYPSFREGLSAISAHELDQP
jgi:nucleoside-diphosphate-sugar epimerase